MIFKSLLRKAAKKIKQLFKVIAKTFAKFMENLTSWLLKAVQAAEKHLGLDVEGTKIFLKHAHQMFKEISKHYSMDERGKWHETTTTREVHESEVPVDILMEAKRKREGEISEEVAEKLELAV